mmetsp:Transcript_14177/g.22132  ORF Transcript_14177/g.22132 Transcript_14177/m.22132 type:complete len:306 (+) Transcript_14177:58-975(+)|eukprot:CAMPEP_0197036694 /NCGR_PEP_ID=MMETSP1384-20130603/14126_1 /TAXON_ID=29189 /ORGANISM="Ammonia sp." /LENGTH=305 /DNA_ID=CAMNT_0042466895 /DNA_START=53 /DNA_END=970 /DNA_ORIENTATION=+
MSNSTSAPPTWTKFATSGLGGATGWLFIHPADVIKVRCQIHEEGAMTMMGACKNMLKEEGVLSFYSGLSAAITRQLTYTTLRLGLYEVIREKVVARNATNDRIGISVWQKLGTGLTSGGIAATICCPVEVALIRMQADGAQKVVAKRRGYKNVFDALFRVGREEGITTLWRGVIPTVTRGMVVSCVQLGSYDQAKESLKKLAGMQEGVKLHLTASITSGYLYCLASLPLDITKTRMQNQPSLYTGAHTLKYTSVPQTLYYIAANEGFLSLWKGFTPYFARSGGHTITMFLCVEQYKKMFTSMYSV